MGRALWILRPGRISGTEQPNFLSCLERSQRGPANFSSSFFDVSRADWRIRFDRLRGWLMEINDRIPAHSRRRVLETVAEAWTFKQRNDFIQEVHTSEEEASFTMHMMADFALVIEIKSINPKEASSMDGLPEIMAKKGRECLPSHQPNQIKFVTRIIGRREKHGTECLCSRPGY